MRIAVLYIADLHLHRLYATAYSMHIYDVNFRALETNLLARKKQFILLIPFCPRHPGKKEVIKGDRWLSASHGDPTPTWFSRWLPSLRDPYFYGLWLGRSIIVLSDGHCTKQLPHCLSNETFSLFLQRDVVAHRYTCSHQNRKYLMNVYAVLQVL